MIVTPKNSTSILVQWKDLEGSSFRISRSTSPEGVYEILEDALIEPFYVDDDVNLFQNGLRYYYKVEGFEGGVIVGTTTNSTSGYTLKNSVGDKLLYENQLALRVMNNPPVKILLKKRDGKRCPECWNPITKKVRYSNCEVCNGTGFIGGYHSPIETRISRDFSQLVDFQSMVDDSKTLYTPVSAWITNYPLVSPGDVVVDVMGQRFSIERVGQRTYSQFIIRQILDLSPLEKGHPSYNAEVEWGEKNE